MPLTAAEHHLYAALAAAGTFVAVLAVWWIARAPARAERIAAWRGIVPPFVNIPGTLFALTLAFIANDTWVARDRANDAVFREAETIRTLLVLSQSVASPETAVMTAELRDYARALVTEWPSLRTAAADPAADRAARTMLARAAAPGLQAAAPPAVAQALIEGTMALRRDRDLRIALTQTHLNPLKWLAMALLGFLTLVSVAVVHADNPRAAILGVALFSAAAAPASAIVLMQGNPFQWPAAVTPEPIAAALDG